LEQTAGTKSKQFKFLCDLFGIIDIVDITGGITQAAFSCQVLISCSLKSL